MKNLMLSLLFVISLSAFSPSFSIPADTKQVFVETNHAKLFCQVMGRGVPIIVLHGGAGLSQDYLLPQMSKLAEDHLVIFYDQRGGGRSEDGNGSAYLRLDVFVEDLEAIRKEFGLKKVCILAHSWGGFLGMQYAISHPESVDKLILMNSMPASSEDFALFVKEFCRRTAPFQKELEKLKNSHEFAVGDPHTVESYLKILFRTYCRNAQKADELHLRASPQANRNWVKTGEIFEQTLCSNPFDLRNDLKKLSCRTLIIHGDQDVVPVSTAENIHKNIPNSQLVVMKDCGHFPYVEKPEEFFRLLNTFLHDTEQDSKNL
jgi:proline iminopeptidase